MVIYEIVKEDILEKYHSGYLCNTSVITATMDKATAEQMIAIYNQNCGDREKYSIRTIKGE